jgi:hypothetical protein
MSDRECVIVSHEKLKSRACDDDLVQMSTPPIKVPLTIEVRVLVALHFFENAPSVVALQEEGETPLLSVLSHF